MTERPRWEYFVLEILGAKVRESKKLLDDYGKGGWELVAVAVQFNEHTLYFKRPIVNRADT